MRIQGESNIQIGDNVIVNEYAWLAALPLTGEVHTRLDIGSGTVIGDFNHIFATRLVEIGEKVLTANHVFISDSTHGFSNISKPVLEHEIEQLSEVRIGEGSWLGEHVCVLGASIGKHCVIGANSVVTRDIPDYCVAVGAPARVVKRYNIETGKWEKV